MEITGVFDTDAIVPIGLHSQIRYKEWIDRDEFLPILRNLIEQYGGSGDNIGHNNNQARLSGAENLAACSGVTAKTIRNILRPPPDSPLKELDLYLIDRLLTGIGDVHLLHCMKVNVTARRTGTWYGTDVMPNKRLHRH